MRATSRILFLIFFGAIVFMAAIASNIQPVFAQGESACRLACKTILGTALAVCSGIDPQLVGACKAAAYVAYGTCLLACAFHF